MKTVGSRPERRRICDGRQMSGGIAMLAVLALAGGVPALRAQGDEWDRPYSGWWPEPLDPRDHDGDRAATFVVDAETGRPVAGARLLRYQECVDATRAGGAPLLAASRTDAQGFASVALDDWNGDSHWIVEAPGFASGYRFGHGPGAVMALGSGVEVQGRLLDALGRPVAGAAVGFFIGCGHAPALRTVQTAADGTFILGGIDPFEGQIWITAPGVLSEYLGGSILRNLGPGRADLRADPSLPVAGRVLAPDGTPIARACVRGLDWKRGPCAFTDVEGRFTLHGIEKDANVAFHHPAGRDVSYVLGRGEWSAGVPLAIPLTPFGSPWDDEAGAGEIVVTVVDAATGEPMPHFEIRVVRRKDGRTFSAVTADGDDGPAGTARIAGLPDDDYAILPESPFTASGFAPVQVRAGSRDPALVEVRSTPRPRLRIEGDIPDGARVILTVEGTQVVRPENADAVWRPHLPAGEEAVLTVTAGAPCFFPVDPDLGGERRVRVQVPGPRRIRLRGVPAAGRQTPVHLRCGRVRVDFRPSSDGTFATHAAGRLTLVLEDADPTGRDLRVPIEIPTQDGPEPLDLGDAGDLVRNRQARVRVDDSGGPINPSDLEFCARHPGDPPEESVTVAVRGASGGGVEVAIGIPSWIEARRPSYQPLRSRIEAPGEHVLRWGSCEIAWSIVDGEGSPRSAVVIVDGERHDAPDGRCSVRGLGAGSHDVLVLSSDAEIGGRSLRFVLREGEIASRTVRMARPE